MSKKLSHGEQLLNALKNIGNKRADKVPEGFLTIRQWAEECGTPRRTMIERMDKLVSAGKSECRVYGIRVNAGIFQVKHYRLTHQREHHAAD